MGLDQSVYFIQTTEGLKDIYAPDDPDLPEALGELGENLSLRRVYSVQGFISRMVKKRFPSTTIDLYGAYVRLYPEDVKELYALTADPEKMVSLQKEWRETDTIYDSYDQERDRNFCKDIIREISFWDTAAYFSSDW